MQIRHAQLSDLSAIWQIIQDAIQARKEEGSDQWQDGYPNPQVLEDDIQKAYAYVLCSKDEILAYAALIFGEDPEPAYASIDGAWLSNQPYVVVHRVATAKKHKGKGIATYLFREIEKIALEKSYFSIKVDTNYDNLAMLKLLDNLEYSYCGIVVLPGGERKAYEKILS